MIYTVTHPFLIFVYNNKTKGHKLKRYEQGDKVTESMKKRLHNPEYYLDV